MQSSLRLRLVLLILVPMLLVSSLAVFWRYSVAKETAEDIFDRNLIMLNIAVSRDVALSQGDSLSQTTLNLFRLASGGDIFYHVYGPDGSFVTGYSSPPIAPDQTASKLAVPIVYEAVHLGTPVRAVRLAEVAEVDGITGVSVVTVWQHLNARQGFARNLAVKASFLAAVLLLTAGALVWFGIRIGLQPLVELERAIQKRSPDDLTPITRKIPREAQGIVSRLNTLFEALSTADMIRDRFISNAAHQLRNPIAGIHSLAQAVQNAPSLEESKTRSEALVSETRRTVHLMEQFLSFERLKGRSQAFEAVDINALLITVANRNAPVAFQMGVEFSLNQQAPNVTLSGDPILLAEAVQNLIDNAMRHGGDTMSYIDVSLRITDGSLIISVQNDGSTVSKTDAAQIFDRFVQATPKKGSGLGLAIVQEIAHLHEGMLSLNLEGDVDFCLKFDNFKSGCLDNSK